METLSLHEASPGHHFQVSIQQELEGVPRFRRFGGDYTAYVEGWALYAESLGKELGLFTDPYQWFGRLNDEQLRAMRLVVDTGLHAKGWTREQAIKFMLDNSTLAESDVVSEVERYIAWPGQALGYKVGRPAHPGLAPQGGAGARAEVRRARFPPRSAERRRRADGRARGEGRALDRGAPLKPGECGETISWLPLLVATLALAACDFAPEPPTRAEEQPSALSAPLRAANADAAELYRVVETYFDQYLALNPIRRERARRPPVRRSLRRLRQHELDGGFARHRAGIAREAGRRSIRSSSQARTSSPTRRSSASANSASAATAIRANCWRSTSSRNWPGVFAQLGSGKGAHPFRTTRDYDNFLARMDGFVVWVDQAINNLRAGVTKGVVLPQVVVERTLPQLEAFGRLEDPRQTVFWQPLLNFPAGPSVADRRRLLQAYDEKLRTQVLPAYRRLHDYLAQEYLPKARDTVSWSDLPSGDLWYAHLVRYYTSTNMTPADVHELGLREVARLRANLVGLQGALGVAGEPRAVFDALRADPRFQFGDAQSMLAGYAALHDRVDARLPALFLRRPQATFEIRPVEGFSRGLCGSGVVLTAECRWRDRPASST